MGDLLNTAAEKTWFSLAVAGAVWVIVLLVVASSPPLRQRVMPSFGSTWSAMAVRMLNLFVPLLFVLYLGWVGAVVGWSTRELRIHDFVFAGLGTGLASMVIIETIKRTIPVRTWYARHALRRWLRDRSEDVAGGNEKEAIVLATMTYEFIRGALGPTRQKEPTGRIRVDAWGDPFNLAAPQLVAQISAAVNDLARPAEPAAAQGEVPALVRRVAPTPVIAETPPSELSAATTDRPGAVQTRQVFALTKDAAPTELLMDQLQTFLAGRWRRRIQLAACILAALAASVGSLRGIYPFDQSVWTVVDCFFLGGSVAWLSRDLVAVVERARR